jgi:adenine-specific DNA-methyltransferase
VVPPVQPPVSPVPAAPDHGDRVPGLSILAEAGVVASVRAEVVVLSYDNESWLSFDELHELCRTRGHVQVLAFDSARYVGARIGVHNRSGHKVGSASHLRSTEYLVVAGDRRRVRPMVAAVAEAGPGWPVDRPVAPAVGRPEDALPV